MKYKVCVHIIENNKNVYTEDKARFEESGDAINYSETLVRRYTKLNEEQDISVIVYKSGKVWYVGR